MRLLRNSAAALLVSTLVLAACDEARVGGRPAEDDDVVARARYSRELIFVADDATGAALLDFSAADVGSAVRRSARGWAEAGSGWTPLFDLAWEGVAVRRPWRLVPHGPVRLRVGLNDEVEAVHVRDGADDLATLEYGDFHAAWTPHATSQVVLRDATLAIGPETMSGWLIDARFGVTEAADAPEPAPESIPAPAPAPGTTPDDGAGDGEPVAAELEFQEVSAQSGQDSAAPADDALTDSALVDSTSDGNDVAPSMRVRTVRGALFAEGGATLVLGQTDSGLAGWFRSEDVERTFTTVTLTAVAGERASWTIAARGDATLSGTLMVMDEAPMPLSPNVVRGTVTISGPGGGQLEMHGVLRPEAARNAARSN